MKLNAFPNTTNESVLESICFNTAVGLSFSFYIVIAKALSCGQHKNECTNLSLASIQHKNQEFSFRILRGTEE